MRVLTLGCVTIAMLAAGLMNSATLRAEAVRVTGRMDSVNLQHFSCNEIHRTRVVKRVCYDGVYDYLLVLIGKKYLHYCTVDDAAIHKFLDAPNKDRHYDRFVKNRFSCRGKKLPT